MIRTIISITFALAAGAVFILFTKPLYDDVQIQQVKMSQYDAALAKARDLDQINQNLRARFNSFNPSDLERLAKLLPDHVDNIGLILDLDSVASKYGMPLENVDVTSPTVSGSNATPSAVGAIGSGGKKYQDLTVKFSTNGTYDSFRAFMSALESSLRVVDTVNLNITSANSKVGNQNLYQFNVTLRTYWVKT